MKILICVVTLVYVVPFGASGETPDEDSIIVEASSRWKRQFVSVTGIGQYPGFPPGWPFGINGVQQPPNHLQQVPLKPTQTSTTSKPSHPPSSESCLTVRGDKGQCATLRQCYPILYTYGGDTSNDTVEFVLRNQGLAEILRNDVSGPCDTLEHISNQFLFRADAEFRRQLICCPTETPHRPPPPVQQLSTTTTTTTTTTRSIQMTTVKNFPNRMPPFGHRPPTPLPGKQTTQQVPVVSSSCGIAKIVGGAETVAGKYPWMAALMNGPKQFCGGSLIDNQHILTASHCIAHMKPHDVARIRVLLGAQNIYHKSPRTIVKKVARVVRHRYFSHQSLHNDVAVLKLDTPVTFSDYVSPICLARGQNRFSNYQATVAGWGSLSEHGGQPSSLREVTIDVWPNEKCKQKYGHLAPGGITEHMVCAGSSNRDACRGDSGGPLMSHTGNYYEQIGIVSWGIGCGRYPGVYSRVTDFLGWITKNLY